LKESEIQSDIMNALTMHPNVVWAHVTTVGNFKGHNGHRFKSGFKGLSDILGQLKDGRLLAIEVKREGKKPTCEQTEFINMCNKYGGAAGVARNVDDALELIK